MRIESWGDAIVRRQIQNDADDIAAAWGRVVFFVCGSLIMAALVLAVVAALRSPMDSPAQALECPRTSCHG